MAVLKGNVLVATPDGRVVQLTQGTDRSELEDQAGDLGAAAQQILDNDAHWVDALPEPDEGRRNLLDSEASSPVKRRGGLRRSERRAEDVVTEAEAPKSRRKAADTPEE